MVKQLLSDLVNHVPDKCSEVCILDQLEVAKTTRKDEGQIFQELNNLGNTGRERLIRTRLIRSSST